MDNEEIEIFREYLRIPTVQPNVDYSENKLIEEKSVRCTNLNV